MKKIIALILALAMCLPLIACGGNPAETTGATTTTTAKDEETVVINGLTAGQLDAVPCIKYSGFFQAMDKTWNFGWYGDGSKEHNATKIDFEGTKADSTMWHLGTTGDASVVENAGIGVRMLNTGKGSTAYMYNKVLIPETITELRVWAIGITNHVYSGAGNFRLMAIYRENGGEYVTKVIKPLTSSLIAKSTTELLDDGSVKFTEAKGNMPGTRDQCMLSYDIKELPTGQEVILMIESMGLGEIKGTAETEGNGGTPAGEIMTDMVTVKRVMVMAPSVPLDEGVEVSVPTNGGEQELLFKIEGNEGLYMTFMPPTTKVYEKSPVLIPICGGGWTGQSRANILNMLGPMIATLRAAGFSIACPDYRVISNTNGLLVKDQVVDVMDAVRYVVRHADALNVDTERIVTTGHSAGAHLALMAAHGPQDQFPGAYDETYKTFACVSFAAVTYIEGTNWQYIATKNGQLDKAMAELCSPITHVKADNAPTMMIHGTADFLVPIRNAEMVMDKAEQAGAPYEILVSEGGDHTLSGSGANPTLMGAMGRSAFWLNDLVKAAK